MSRMFPRFFRFLHTIFDVGLLCALWWLAAYLDRWLGLKIPAGVVGMGFLFVLLITGVVPLRKIKPGADWLLAEMLLFFVPACVGVVRYFPVLETYGIRLVVVVVIGTISVMASTALAVDGIYRLERRMRAGSLKRHRREEREALGFEGAA